MAWHYFRDGITQGPVELAELQRLRQEGIVEATTLVWSEGMADWKAFQDTSAATTGAVAGGIAPARRGCAECGKSFPEDEMLQYEHAWVCAACKPIFFQRIKEGVSLPGKLHYASVGRRWVAVFIDGILMYIVIFIPIILIVGIGGITGKGQEDGGPSIMMNIFILLYEYLVPALYEIILIGAYGATLGKMAMKIKVVTPEGEPISYGRATGRYFGKMLSGITLGIGYLMAFWDDEKRALHDRVCKTRVVSVETS